MTDNRTLPSEQTRTYAHLTKPQRIAPSLCGRCGGAGGYDGWPGYTCFRCAGDGTDPTYKNWGFPTGWTLDEMLAFYDKKDETNRKARERRAAKKERGRDEMVAWNIDTYPGFGTIVDYIKEVGHTDNTFVSDVYNKASTFQLTEPQAEAVIKSFHQDQIDEVLEVVRRESIPEITEEKAAVINGTIVTQKYVSSQWGDTLKMLILLDNGQKLWGTVPTTLDEAEVDDRVTFTANVSPSGDDPIFGFFSRPRKGEVLGRQESRRDE